MPDQKEIDATIDRLHAAGATDAEVTSLIREKYGKPFDINASRAALRFANSKPLPAAPGLLESFGNPGTVHIPLVGDVKGPTSDVLDGMNAAHEGNYPRAAHNIITGVSKVVAPAALPAIAAAPVAALGGAIAGGVGTVAAREGTKLVTDNPDAVDLAGDIGGFVGAPAGGAATELAQGPTRAALRFAGAQLAEPEGFKQMAGRAMLKLTEPKEIVPASVLDSITHSASLNESDALVAKELARQHLEATRTNKVTDATRAAQTPTRAEMGVVSAADASAANPSVARATDTRPGYQMPTGRTAADATTAADADTLSRVVPTADDAGRSLFSATADIPPKRTPIVNNAGPRDMTEPSLFGDPTAGAYGDAGPSEPPSLQRLADLTVVGNDGQPIGAAPTMRPRVRIDSNGNIIVPDGSIPVASRGLEATLTPEQRALIGNRKGGAMTLAQRKSLLDTLIERTRNAAATGGGE